jgi:galactokinase
MEMDIPRQFQQYFGNSGLLTAAPGRVNLIGEHTDYNEGFVLPGAINRNIYVALSPAADAYLYLRAFEYPESYRFSLDDMHPVKGWPTYLLGMIYLLMPQKRLANGLQVAIAGDVPVGAGMSSSAALCSAFGLALNETYGLGLSGMEIALAAQKTEQLFAGLQCGIMDPFASLHGKAGYLMKLDCRSLEFDYIPFHFPELCIILVNTMVSHSLASSEYNLRRQQCEAGVELLQKYDPSLRSLRDVSGKLLAEHREEMDAVVYARCRFVIEENQRLLDGCICLKNNDPDAFGRLMYASHEGLSKDYAVSCPESDFLVHSIKGLAGVKGARQMGGGFGGCIITLVEKNAALSFIQVIQQKYECKYGKSPDCYTVVISDGARVIKSSMGV